MEWNSNYNYSNNCLLCKRSIKIVSRIENYCHSCQKFPPKPTQCRLCSLQFHSRNEFFKHFYQFNHHDEFDQLQTHFQQMNL